MLEKFFNYKLKNNDIKEFILNDKKSFLGYINFNNKLNIDNINNFSLCKELFEVDYLSLLILIDNLNNYDNLFYDDYLYIKKYIYKLYNIDLQYLNFDKSIIKNLLKFKNNIIHLDEQYIKKYQNILDIINFLVN